MSEEFFNLGYEVKIILFEKKIEYGYRGEIIDLKTPPSSNYVIKLFRFIQRTIKLKTIFKKQQADYIFSFMESCNFVSILTGEEVVVSIRNNPLIKHKGYQKFLIKCLYKFKNVKKIITVSKEIERILNVNYVLKNTKTIYNPIVINNYQEKENLSLYKPFLLSIGRLDSQKNFSLLIKAFSKSKAIKDAKILIIGEGEQRFKLESLISSLKLKEKVFLLGQKTNVLDYYKQCDMFILPSRFEGFPNVLIEALSNECVCIATDCPTGPNEIIQNNFNGMLIKNNNEKIMSEAIDRVFFDAELKNLYIANSKKSIHHLSLEKIAQEWLKI